MGDRDAPAARGGIHAAHRSYEGTEIPEPPRERLRRLIGAAGFNDALAPFLVQDDKHVFAPAGTDGAVVYGRAGHVAIVVGDPIGPGAWATLDAFRARTRRSRLAIGVYQATGESLGPLELRGFHHVPIGEEAVIDLQRFDLSGSRRANLRHTITRARRDSVEVTWHPNGTGRLDQAALQDVASLDSEWSAGAGPSMGFTITRFRPAMVVDAPTAIAVDGTGRRVALITIRPCGPGAFVLDVMRRRPGSVPGALEACIAVAAAGLRDTGARTLSLGLAPLAGLDPRSDVAEERVLARLVSATRNIYDVEGLTFFKRKFDPTWHRRYLAVESRRSFLPVAAAILWLHLAEPGRESPAVAAGVVAGVGRAAVTELRAMSPEARAGVRSRARTRAAVAISASAAAWAGARVASAGQGGAVAVAVSAIAVAAGGGAALAGRRSRVAASLTAGVSRGAGTGRAGRSAEPGHDERASGTAESASPRVTVLVPARNEELVLPQLVEDLAGQDHRDKTGVPLFRVIVIDDRSNDQTLHRSLAAARRLGIQSLVSFRTRRGRDLPAGKGAALQFVPVAECDDVILVLDADARIEPTVLREVAALASSGLHAFTLRRRVLATGDRWLAQAQADEQSVDAMVEQARWEVGGCSQFRGNGMVITRDLLERAGGWRPVLTEDLDLSARVAATSGEAVAWPATPSVGEQPAWTPGDLWRQRVRWAEGALRAAIEWTPAQVTSQHLRLSRRLDRLGYVVQLLIPFAVAGALANAVARRSVPRFGAVLGSVYGSGVLFAFVALGSGAAVPAFRPRTVRSLRAGALISLWQVAVPAGALRVFASPGDFRYTPTPHTDHDGHRL